MVYGVKNVKGKLIVEPYDSEENVPENETCVAPEELQDLIETGRKNDAKQ